MRQRGVMPVVAAVGALAACAAALGLAHGARAAQPACSTAKAFAQFGDAGSYALLINGSLEQSLNAFQFTGNPKIVKPNESYYLHAKGDQLALQLGSGDTATFHAGCVPRLDPSFRLVARANGTAGSLDVAVQYTDLQNVVRLVDLGSLDASGYQSWTPTPVLQFLDPGQRYASQAQGTPRLILTPSGQATWQVDDLYIDPHAYP